MFEPCPVIPEGMRVADYRTFQGPVIVYDTKAPCKVCGLPVQSASMGGTDVCPPCDCGRYRDGRSWETVGGYNLQTIRENAARIQRILDAKKVEPRHE